MTCSLLTVTKQGKTGQKFKTTNMAFNWDFLECSDFVVSDCKTKQNKKSAVYAVLTHCMFGEGGLFGVKLYYIMTP